MILYHGSNTEVKNPDLKYSRRSLDFGTGFYLTSSIEQAQSWAKRVVNVKRSGSPTVSVFETGNGFDRLEILRFDTADAKWLSFVASNRSLSYKGRDYDAVIGPVANDTTFDVLSFYMSGIINVDIALQMLMPQKLKDQWVIKTEKGLKEIIFREAFSV